MQYFLVWSYIYYFRFSLQMKKGGLVRIHDSILMEESKYKCLLISDETTVEDVIRYNSIFSSQMKLLWKMLSGTKLSSHLRWNFCGRCYHVQYYLLISDETTVEDVIKYNTIFSSQMKLLWKMLSGTIYPLISDETTVEDVIRYKCLLITDETTVVEDVIRYNTIFSSQMKLLWKMLSGTIPSSHLR